MSRYYDKFAAVYYPLPVMHAVAERLGQPESFAEHELILSFAEHEPILLSETVRCLERVCEPLGDIKDDMTRCRQLLPVALFCSFASNRLSTFENAPPEIVDTARHLAQVINSVQRLSVQQLSDTRFEKDVGVIQDIASYVEDSIEWLATRTAKVDSQVLESITDTFISHLYVSCGRPAEDAVTILEALACHDLATPKVLTAIVEFCKDGYHKSEWHEAAKSREAATDYTEYVNRLQTLVVRYELTRLRQGRAPLSGGYPTGERSRTLAAEQRDRLQHVSSSSANKGSTSGRQRR